MFFKAWRWGYNKHPHRHADVCYQSAEANDELFRAVWSRAAETARKLALLYACSENPDNPAISEATARWATKANGRRRWWLIIRT